MPVLTDPLAAHTTPHRTTHPAVATTTSACTLAQLSRPYLRGGGQVPLLEDQIKQAWQVDRLPEYRFLGVGFAMPACLPPVMPSVRTPTSLCQFLHRLHVYRVQQWRANGGGYAAVPGWASTPAVRQCARTQLEPCTPTRDTEGVRNEELVATRREEQSEQDEQEVYTDYLSAIAALEEARL